MSFSSNDRLPIFQSGTVAGPARVIDNHKRAPLSRRSDPHTSVLAAASIAPANDTIVHFIRKALERYGPLDHQLIANAVETAQPNRWTRGSIVSACARADLHQWGTVTNSRNRTVIVWSLEPRP